MEERERGRETEKGGGGRHCDRREGGRGERAERGGSKIMNELEQGVVVTG